MRESIYLARRELFETMNIPVTRSDITILKWKQRARLLFWEGGLRSLLVIKRAVDILISLMALFVLTPLFLVVAICILIDDGFPVLFLQRRVGLYGQEFRMLKFRSMCRNAERLKLSLQDQFLATNTSMVAGLREFQCSPYSVPGSFSSRECLRRD